MVPRLTGMKVALAQVYLERGRHFMAEAVGTQATQPAAAALGRAPLLWSLPLPPIAMNGERQRTV